MLQFGDSGMSGELSIRVLSFSTLLGWAYFASVRLFPGLCWSFARFSPDDIATVRTRFAAFGERWRVEARQNLYTTSWQRGTRVSRPWNGPKAWRLIR